jgi:hypothetical protein
MSDIFEKYAALRQQFPEDIKAIEVEEKRVKDLLSQQEYFGLEQTQRLIALCRKDIVFARKRLATNRSLSEDARRELWNIVDARSWFLEMVVKDYVGELARVEGELQDELSRA